MSVWKSLILTLLFPHPTAIPISATSPINNKYLFFIMSAFPLHIPLYQSLPTDIAFLHIDTPTSTIATVLLCRKLWCTKNIALFFLYKEYRKCLLRKRFHFIPWCSFYYKSNSPILRISYICRLTA